METETQTDQLATARRKLAEARAIATAARRVVEKTPTADRYEAAYRADERADAAQRTYYALHRETRSAEIETPPRLAWNHPDNPDGSGPGY